jgi:hypothetical protein
MFVIVCVPIQVLSRIRKYIQLIGTKIDSIVQQHGASYKQTSEFDVFNLLNDIYFPFILKAVIKLITDNKSEG